MLFLNIFRVFFAVFIVYLPKLTLKREPFALHISYIIIQLLMMQLRYFFIPLVHNGDVKIDYLGPFSQFCTVFLQF